MNVSFPSDFVPWMIAGLIALGTGCQSANSLKSSSLLSADIQYQQIQSSSFFESPQQISMVEIPKDLMGDNSWGIAYSEDSLMKTTSFAQNIQAEIAINAGFFNVKEGGSVTYLEVHDSVVSEVFYENKTGEAPSFISKSVLVITRDNQIQIGPNRGEDYYQKSDRERAVLVTGPLLLQKGKRTELEDNKFATSRHPRSCICETATKSILLIAVDGRSAQAAGMSLAELQEFLLLNNCRDAINLDGGGSTTLWVRKQGILNTPSDKTGERKVANILYFRK